MLTIFTPTYNRAGELVRLYNSLKAQTNQDFEWVVVDDGSTDNTQEQMQGFCNEGVLSIRFFRQENGGKMRAHNRGVEKALGELFVCIDADDWLTADAVEQILSAQHKIVDDRIGGMMFLNLDGETENIVGSPLPWQEQLCSSFDAYNKYGITGDKTMVFKTEIMRAFPFPEIEKEKFVPEALVYNRISGQYVLLCINMPIKRVEYLPDGYSSNYFNVCRKNPKAQILYYRELYPKQPTMYNAAAYDMYCIYAGEKLLKAVRQHPNPIVALGMYLPAYIKYLLKERKK